MIPAGVEIYVCTSPVDMRCYAEPSVMRGRAEDSGICRRELVDSA